MGQHPEDDPETHADAIERSATELLHKAEKQRRTIELLTGPAAPCRVDLVPAIESAVAALTDRYPDATVETVLPSALAAHALEDIGRAIRELLDNAARHAEGSAPWIRITADRTDDRAVVEIQDACPPIPEYEYRILTGEQEMNGVTHTSGLGLWLVYWVVDLSDGHIDFETSPDGGNTVTVSLPLAAEAVDRLD
jgi:signal transduction histidine kinase